MASTTRPRPAAPAVLPLEGGPGSKTIPGAFGRATAAAASDPRAGVIYLGHIPHGFYEVEMRAYFAQFGAVRNVALSRSRRTGRSKGFAFVQFADATVARIAAEAMNGYPLMEKVLVAHVVAPEKVAPDTFRFADREWRKIPWRKVVREAQARPRSADEAERRLARIVRREQAQTSKLQALGIDFQLGASFEEQARRRYGVGDVAEDEHGGHEGADVDADGVVTIATGKGKAAAAAPDALASSGARAAGAAAATEGSGAKGVVGAAKASAKAKTSAMAAVAVTSVAEAAAAESAPPAQGVKRKRAVDGTAGPGKRALLAPSAATSAARAAPVQVHEANTKSKVKRT